MKIGTEVQVLSSKYLTTKLRKKILENPLWLPSKYARVCVCTRTHACMCVCDCMCYISKLLCVHTDASDCRGAPMHICRDDSATLNVYTHAKVFVQLCMHVCKCTRACMQKCLFNCACRYMYAHDLMKL